jgi:hypothetical protein
MITKKFICIGLLSLTILATELFWTRLFSAEFYYTFAFLILSFAILGLGLGALFLKLLPGLDKPKLLTVWLSLTGLMILVSVPCVFYLNLDFTNLISETKNIYKLLAAIVLLGTGYFFAGIALAHILKANSAEIPKLYMSDFLGASIGVVSFIIVMNEFGANVTLIFCSVPVLIASFIIANRWYKIFPVIIISSAILFLNFMGGIPEQKRDERAPVIYRHWDATSKIKVYEYSNDSRSINIDNVANTPVYRFDGNWNIPDSSKTPFDIDIRNLIKKFNNCCFLSLGAGGGGDVLQALQYNVSEIHAVEVIPHINYLMKEGFLKEYSGNIYNDPRVKVITEDARTYIRKFENKFDIIYSLSSNTFAAFASGSFALAENYIFTTEAFKDYWKALSAKGYLSIEHQFYTTRLVAELIDALNELKIENPNSHYAVYNLPALRRKVLLVSKTPLDKETIADAYANSTPGVVKTTQILYPLYENGKKNIYSSIVDDGWKSVADTAKIDISPCVDDKPFVAQQGLMKNLNLSKIDKIPSYEFTGFPLSKVILLIILIVCVVIIIPINFLPYLRKGEKLSLNEWLYFFMLGIAYMMIEVVIIQKYTLFIGSTVYSIALILTVLLISSGIGSRDSGRFAYKIIFPAITLWLLVDIFIFKQLFYLLVSWALIPRMIVSALLIAPLGYFMGMPFPKAASKIPHLVDWAFAVNGSASVIGSVVVVLIATSFGYSTALGVALLVYICAFFFYKKSFQHMIMN